jgi:hypothetical protein
MVQATTVATQRIWGETEIRELEKAMRTCDKAVCTQILREKGMVVLIPAGRMDQRAGVIMIADLDREGKRVKGSVESFVQGITRFPDAFEIGYHDGLSCPPKEGMDLWVHMYPPEKESDRVRVELWGRPESKGETVTSTAQHVRMVPPLPPLRTERRTIISARR